MNKKHTNVVFALFIGIILSFFRVRCSLIKATNITMIMAVVNVIASFFVVLVIINDAMNFIIEDINKCGISTLDKKCTISKINKTRRYAIIILFVISLVAAITYIDKRYSDLINDVLSILALIMSIVSNGISEIIAGMVKRLIK